MKRCIASLASKLDDAVTLWFHGVIAPVARELKVYSLESGLECPLTGIIPLCFDELQGFAFLQLLFLFFSSRTKGE